MYLLRYIFRFFEHLFLHQSSKQLASSVVMGIALGLTPVATLQWVALFGISILFQFNLFLTYFLAFSFFTISPFIHPYFHHLGTYLLIDNSFTSTIISTFLNIPFMAYSKLNHTTIMGAFAFCILISPIVFYLAFQFMEIAYQPLLLRFRNSYFYRFWRTTSIYRTFSRYQQSQWIDFLEKAFRNLSFLQS